jgi:hypothetical protein
LATSGGNVFAYRSTATAVLGVAGDTQSSTSTGSEWSDNVVIGASGSVVAPVAKTRATSNRVSDMFNETAASGKVTVYHGGGTFATDQYVALTYAVGEKLYSNGSGQFTNVDAGSAVNVGIVVKTPSSWPSGVPGADTNDGSTSLGTFLTFKLLV